MLDTLAALVRKLTWLVRRGRKEDELRQELEFHLAEEADDAQAAGLSDAEARLAARRDFGSTAIAIEDTRAAWGWLLLDQTIQDLWYAVRTLARSPGFTTASVLTLALGTGANTAIFSIVNAVMLRPLPYPQADQLVRVLEHLPASMQRDGKPGIFRGLESRDFAAWQQGSQLLSAVAAYDSGMAMTLSDQGREAIRLTGAAATASLFPLLGIQPSLGPGVRADDVDVSHTVMLSSSTWKREFDANPNVVGRNVVLDGTTYRIAGVMPEGFSFPSRSTAFWVPLTLRVGSTGEITDYEVIGRLKDGVSPEAARAEASSLLTGLQGIISERPHGAGDFEILRIQDDLVAPVRPALLVLLAGVGLLLLVACANVANLVLARNSARQGEAAIRVALGAGRSRLMRQMLTESLLLGLAGGAAGMGIAAGGLRLLRSLGPADLPRFDEVQLDLRVFGFALLLSVLTGVLLGSLPAWSASRVDPITGIKSDVGARGTRRDVSRHVLVGAEIALATVLLIGGGLLLRSFVKLANVDPGFDVDRLLVFQVALPRGVGPRTAANAMSDVFRDRLAVLPGVKAVAFANTLPLRQRNGTAPRIEGFPSTLQGRPEPRIVSRNYPSAMGIQLRQGHGLDDDRAAGQPMGVLVNETLARAFGSNVLGRPLTIARQQATIVGVVADTRDRGLDRDIQPLVYIDAGASELRMVRSDSALGWAFYALRTDGDPHDLIPGVRRVLRELVPTATLELDVDSMDGIFARSVAERRFYAVAFGLFAALAVMLAAIGVYGVMAYVVAQRTREIGIRMALGAAALDVLRLVLRQCAPVTFIGIATGVLGALGFTRILQGMLFGLTPLDAPTFIGVALMLAVVATLAALVPATRATRVDPLVALRYE